MILEEIIFLRLVMPIAIIGGHMGSKSLDVVPEEGAYREKNP
jgi:hypothetical protein